MAPQFMHPAASLANRSPTFVASTTAVIHTQCTHLMAVLVPEPHNFVFNGGAIARPMCIDPAAIHRCLLQVGFYERVRGSRGAGQVAVQLCPLHMQLQSVNHTN